jgi:PAS domain S-box-containing protein
MNPESRTKAQLIKAGQHEYEKYQILFNSMLDGYALHEIICNRRGRPVDYRFLDVNPAFEKITGLKKEKILGKTVLEVLPRTESEWIDRYGRVALTGEPCQFEQYAVEFDKYFWVTAFRPAENQFACLFLDVTVRKKAELELMSRNDELEWLLRSMINAFVIFESVFDKKGRFISCRYMYVNDAFSKIMGMNDQDVLGKTIHEIWPGTETEWIKTFGQVAQTGRAKTFDMYHNPSGKWYHCHAYRPRKSTKQFCIILEDISTQVIVQQANLESEEKYRTLFECAQDAIFVADAETGILLEVNSAAERITGYSRSELIGKHQSFLHPADIRHTVIQQFTRAAGRKGTSLHRSVVLHKRGKRIPVEINGSGAVRLGGQVINFGIFRDITEREQIEAALESEVQKRTLDLERSRKAALSIMQDANAEKQRAKDALRKLEKSEKKLIQAKHKAETANQSKGEFLAKMSHEIRTPIHAVTGITHLLKQTPLTVKQTDYIHKIEVASDNLLNIINDILDFSKIEAGKLILEHTVFKLDTVIDNAVSLNLVRAKEKSLEMVINIDPEVPALLIGDSFRLGQILTNLLSNAVKFTHQGEVMIGVDLLRQTTEKADLCFRVKDTGIGMSRKQQKTVFGAFNQADSSTTRQYGGTGLGLTISKQLIELMGGTFEIESLPDAGTTVSICLSFDYPEEQILPIRFSSDRLKGVLILPPSRVIKYTSQSPRRLKGYRVLAVDDNRSTLEAMRNILCSFSFDVTVASSGQEAINILRGNSDGHDRPYNLMIIDWKMPDTDGIETIKTIQKDRKIRVKPDVILMSAFEDAQFQKNARSAGVRHLLEKPFSYSTLFDKVIQVFEKDFKASYKPDQHSDQSEYSLEDLAGSHILVVEDNEINRQVSRELLVQAGFQVTLAGDGREAFQQYIIDPDLYNLILMDIQMPVMDGYEAARQIRLWEKENLIKTGSAPAQVPIVAMTADVMNQVKAECIQSGMNDYISKPVNPVELYKSLYRWIRPGTPSAESTARKDHQHDADGRMNSLRQLKTIDIQDGLKRINQNRTLYCRLLNQFYQNHYNFLEELDHSLKTDPKQAAFIVHSLKGVSGNLGAKQLYEAAKLVDKDFKDQMETIPKEHIERLSHAFKAVFHEIAGLDLQSRFPAPDQTGEVVHPRRLNRELAKLSTFLTENDTDAIELIEALLQLNLTPEFRDELNALCQFASGYEFESALGELEKIKTRYQLDLTGNS